MALFGGIFTKILANMKRTSYYYTFGVLFLLLFANFFLIWLTGHYILTINFYEKSGNIVTDDPRQAILVYAGFQRWIYLFSVIYLLMKLTLITIILAAAMYLSDQHIAFHLIFRVVVSAEFIFIASAAIKLAFFLVLYPDDGLLEWHRFYPLSALSFWKDVSADWSYLMQNINLFEVVYWFLLAAGINRFSKLSYDQALKLVTTSYLPALIIWIIAVTFCAVLLFPQMN